MTTTTVHVDDLGDVTVALLDDPNAPCPVCGTAGDAQGWRILTVAQVAGRRFDVFRCPSCGTACGMAPPPAPAYPCTVCTAEMDAPSAILFDLTRHDLCTTCYQEVRQTLDRLSGRGDR